MDPRAKKTITALRTALFRLLKTTTVDDITVTSLCREAGINRRISQKLKTRLSLKKIHQLIKESSRERSDFRRLNSCPFGGS